MITWLSNTIKARFLVAHLGEKASPPWWSSDVTSFVGKRMLERIYPRTFLAASLETATRAACIEHDIRIGKLGTYHLFRLPSTDELAIIDVLHHQEGIDLLRELNRHNTDEQMLLLLKNLTSNQIAPSNQGPVRCGAVEDLYSCRPLQLMCAAYLIAFEEKKIVYPYLLEE